MATSDRTLVKSQPELWGIIEQPERLEGWSSGLFGYAARIEVTGCEPERRLSWEAAAADEVASIEVELSKKGWGTNVVISAESEGATATRLERWIEAVLDELGSTEKRPFEGIV